ncbi:MAG: flagellar hook protein FlgE [Balneolaceae bacterium]|nr:flagellar hook protein FlgE [Balneolaceae bacterium]
MSLVKSLNSGVSGLKAFQTKMDVIGNNIANVETAGFKSSSVSFAEMMSERLGRAGGGSGQSAPQLSNQVGLGVRVASVNRDFSQGAMQNTGRTTDLAIEGNGYFMVSDGGEDLMTRAGNFVFNKDGYFVDQGGRAVQGYIADSNGNILGGGATDDIRIDFENSLPPKQTQKVTLAGNLNADTSTNKVLQAQSGFTTESGDIALESTEINNLGQTLTDLADGDQISFDVVLNDGTTQTITHTYTTGDTLGDMVDSFNTGLTDTEGQMSIIDGMLNLNSSQLGESDLDITSVSVTGTGDINFPGLQVTQEGQTNTQTMSATVYDEIGRAHSLMLDFTQSADNEWEYNARFMDGENITSGKSGTISFDELGQLSSDDLLNISFEPGNGATATSFAVELGDSETGTRFTQYAGSNSAKVISQDGYTQGELIDVAIDGSGQIEGIYDNGNSKVLAQVALAQVQNQNGLETVGSGLFRKTSAAGEMFVNTAANFTGTAINSGNLEGSNVDLAQEFTAMITSQRAYQSNARVIRTSDEMLTEAVNLKR